MEGNRERVKPYICKVGRKKRETKERQRGSERG